MKNRGHVYQRLSVIIRITTIAVILLGTVGPVALASELTTQLYVSHRARLTAEIPGDWTLSPDSLADYRGSEGFVISHALVGARLEDVCDSMSASILGGIQPTPVTWKGADACQLDGSYESVPARTLIVANPHPFTIGSDTYQFAAITTDRDHFHAVVDSVSFDPARVTPQAYAESVLDIMEARAWWANGVDWEKLRTDAEPLLEDADTLADVHFVIQQAILDLRSAGDNHSQFREDVSFLSADENTGYGMTLSGRTVTLVYPSGPAARSGLQTGDSIEYVDEQRFQGFQPLEAVASGPTTLRIQRPGVGHLMSISIESGPYSRYVPPTVERLQGDIGYVELFGNFGVSGTEQNYVAAAQAGIEQVDQQPVCGWIIDLRRNDGGNYMPMVTAVGPILGNGPILQWVLGSGEATIVEYRDGQVIDDGRVVSDGLVQGPPPALQQPDVPVAVLIGPNTGSSGEATALAFVGRPETQLFGETTGGYTTANYGYPLFDGALLLLAQAAMADRTGVTHLDGIEPDHTTPVDWTVYGTEEDSAIKAAVEWLDQLPECSGE